MILPQSSRILIIDDDPKEMQPLLLALSRSECSSVYFSGRDDAELPAEPFRDVRIAFLDLHLSDAVTGPAAAISSFAIDKLARCVSAGSKYILVAWTKHADEITALKRDLVTARIPPIIPIIDLDKTACLSAGDPVKMIERKIRQKINSAPCDMFKFFLAWENMVAASGADVVNEFTELAGTDNLRLSDTLRRLAEANAGDMKTCNKVNDVAKNSLMALGGVLHGKLHDKILVQNFRGMKTPVITNPPGGTKAATAEINRKLNIMKPMGAGVVPGNVYLSKRGKKALKEIVCPIYTDNSSVGDGAVASGLKAIFIEVSPVCDHAQGNVLHHRIVHGVMCPADSADKFKNFSEDSFIYKSSFNFEHEGKIWKLFLNKRQFETRPAIKNFKLLFRIGYDWLFEIQHKIAGHGARPGVTAL